MPILFIIIKIIGALILDHVSEIMAETCNGVKKERMWNFCEGELGKCIIYADDLVLWSTEEYATAAKIRLQEATNILSSWEQDWYAYACSATSNW